MSWSTYKNIIEGVLTANDYREIPENKTVETAPISHNHQSFLLKPIGTGEIVETTSNGIQYSHNVLLEVKYKNIDASQRHVNYQSFLNLFKAIATLEDYKGTLSNPDFRDVDEKHVKGSFTFLFGEEIQC